MTPKIEQVTQPPDYFTSEEISAAYRRARLRYCGITLFQALNNPLIYKSLCVQCAAARKLQTHVLEAA